jgi:23S rRNA (uracil747-C5)-methyltransferase
MSESVGERCHVFDEGRCRSCTLLSRPEPTRQHEKERQLRDYLLSKVCLTPDALEPMVRPTSPWNSRNKIKLAVAGTPGNPVVGIVDRNRQTVPLLDCPLPRSPLRDLAYAVAHLIAESGLPPYDIERRSGEIKGIIACINNAHEQGLLRIVLRSKVAIPSLHSPLMKLNEQFPWLKVLSCNIQPIPAAILEGPEEVLLSDEASIREQYENIPVYFGPQSFMQVTHEVASALYARFGSWVQELQPERALDLFCGAGAFALFATRAAHSVVGFDISADAIACANRSATEIGARSITFQTADLTSTTEMIGVNNWDLVTVNPPRRGLGQGLCDALLSSGCRWIIYSSCNPETLCRDLSWLSARYGIQRAAPFDMFPLTGHSEVLVLLQRTTESSLFPFNCLKFQ